MGHFSAMNTEGARMFDDRDSKSERINEPIRSNTSPSILPKGDIQGFLEGKVLSDTPATTPANTAPNSPAMYVPFMLKLRYLC